MTSILSQIIGKQSLDVKVYFCFFIDSKTDKDNLEKIVKLLKMRNIKFDIFECKTYWKKVVLASHVKSQTLVKWDEDIFMSSHHVNAYFEAVMKESWEEFDVLSPVVTTGIPTCELFLDSYMDVESSKSIRIDFSHVEFFDWWDGQVTYKELNGFYNPENWNDFQLAVNGLKHKFKGIHPVRISNKAQTSINRWVIENNFWLTWSPPKEIVKIDSSSYFCNSIFACSPQLLSTIVHLVKSGKIAFDGFDELPLNEILNQKNRRIGFLTNSLAIHPSYNSIGQEFEDISDEFYSQIKLYI